MTKFVIVALLAVHTTPGVNSGSSLPESSGQTPRIVRAYVFTEESGHPDELAARRTSVKDLSDALASKKKTIAVVKTADEADIEIEIVGRGINVPKVVIGLGPRPGETTIPSGPARMAELRVRAEAKAGLAADFKNKNRANDHPRGWRSAADDLADQIDKWLLAHREKIGKGS